MLKKVKSQMRAPFFDPSDYISIISFLAISKLACNTNLIYEGDAMWVYSFFIENVLAPALSICMLAATNIAPNAASVHSAEPLRH